MISTQSRATISKVMVLGMLLATLMAASLTLAARSAHASTTFTVNSTADHSDANLGISACDTGYTVTGAGGAQVPECTLRAAIQQANATTGADVINFNIAGTGVHTIAPASELPTVAGPVSINGYSQPGAKPNQKAVGSDAVLKIELSGASALGAEGLVIGAANSTVKGLVINRWSQGIRIDGANATGNKVLGNYVGTDATGTKALSNSDGVYIADSNNTIGGTTAGARNIIAFNGEAGVVILGGSATGNRVLQNSIFSTIGLGIDLNGDGPTANDTGDTDTGPNGLQNKPVLASAKTGGGTTTVNARLNSIPNRTFKVEFFSNPSGTDEGKKFIGQRSVTTDGSGNVTFTFSPAQEVRLGRTVTATATDPGGNTSEFSAARTVVAK